MTAKDGKEKAGVMIPIPQYPLYTATLAEYNAYPVSSVQYSDDSLPLVPPVHGHSGRV